MTSRTRVLAGGMTLLSLLPAAGPASAGAFDGSKPLLCAVSTIMECDASGQCERSLEAATGPTFFRIDVKAATITAGARKSTVRHTTRMNGRLILQGGEEGRGWTATIDEDSGQLSAAVAADDFTFSIFGGCTLP